MIVVYHKNNKVVALSNSYNIDKVNTISIAQYLSLLAKEYPEAILVWCHINLKEQLNVSELEHLFHHRKLLFSYNPFEGEFLDKSVGYVDESPFIKVNKSVAFPTWQMSSWVGGMHSKVILALKNEMPLDNDFNYFLCSLAKLSMPKGLLCYSEPQLVKQMLAGVPTKTSYFILFRFVKQHYKTQWVFVLLLNMMLYERKFPVLPFLFSLFYKNRTKLTVNLDGIKVQSSRKLADKATVDVIIPTIGRSTYLYDVLKDFAKQTLLPRKIIIVEQNPVAASISELDYLTNEKWPFEIQHIFIHQAGACNARNLALAHTESEWVFLADDDNRFGSHLLEDIFEKIKQYGNPVVTTSYPQKNESRKYTKVIQWPTFGAGNSFVRRDLLEKVRFNMGFEYGYGEDSDFGMQLRNKGYDIVYLPEPQILHLKAPVGGFRTKPELLWKKEPIQPKPSPTVMLYLLSHNSKEQLLGYKTILFFKFYKHQNIKNPYNYFKMFQKQWNQSILWANQLKKTS